MRTRPCALILILHLVACGRAEPPAAATDATRLAHALRSAADRHGVPEPLLAGIGYVQTRWWLRPGEPSIDRGYGPMHLVEGPGGSLERAAALSGRSPAALRTSLEANLEGGAALLRAEADRYFAEYRDRREDVLAHWWQVVMRASGASDPEIANGFARDVYRAVRRGARAQLPDGSLFETPAQLVETDGEDLFAAVSHPLAPDYASAEWYPAAGTNFTSGRGGTAIDRVIVHTVQGSYWSCINWFKNPAAEASSHYVVSAGGAVASMVHDADTAWHAGNWEYNQRSIGIEHEGHVDDPNWTTPALYQASANLTRWLCDAHGIPKDRSHVIGHNEVPDPYHAGQWGGAGHHHDPCVTMDGSQCHWDWAHYMSLVTGGTPPPQTGLMKGVVFGSDGGCRYDGAWRDCSVKLAGAHVRVPETGADVVTDAGGSFSISLPVGGYTPTASAAGYRDGTPVLGNPRQVVAGGIAWSSFILQKGEVGSVAGFVYAVNPDDESDRSRRLSGAHLALGALAADSASDGAFRLEAVPTGAGELVAALAGHETARVAVEVAAGAEKTVEVGLRRVAGADGHVRDAATGAPVAGAIVQVGDRSAETDAAGAWSLDLEPGAPSLSVQAVGYEARALPTRIRAGARTQLETWLRPTGGEPLVQITSPADGAEVEALPLEVTGRVRMHGLATLSVRGIQATVDADGTFRAKVTLDEGPGTIDAVALARDGLEARASVRVVYDAGCGCASPGPASLLALLALASLRRRR